MVAALRPLGTAPGDGGVSAAVSIVRHASIELVAAVAISQKLQ